MLETVSEFAAHRLSLADEEDETNARHLAWFGRYASRADEMLAQADGHRLIDEETANLRRALERATRRDPAAALQMAASLTRHWVLGEHFQEGRSACAEALSSRHDGEELDRAVLRSGAAVFELMAENYAEALESVQAALTLLPEVRDTEAEDRPGVLLIGADPDRRGPGGGIPLRRAGGRARAVLRETSSARLRAGQPLDLRRAVRALRSRSRRIRGAPRDPARLRSPEAADLGGAGRGVGSCQRRLAAASAPARRSRARAGGRRADDDAFPGARLPHPGACPARGDRPGVPGGRGGDETSRGVGRAGRGAGDRDGADGGGAARGNPDAAGERARRLLGMPHLHTLALAHETLARAALGQGDIAEAEAEGRELEAIAERSGASARPRSPSG